MKVDIIDNNAVMTTTKITIDIDEKQYKELVNALKILKSKQIG